MLIGKRLIDTQSNERKRVYCERDKNSSVRVLLEARMVEYCDNSDHHKSIIVPMKYKKQRLNHSCNVEKSQRGISIQVHMMCGKITNDRVEKTP